MSAVGHMVCPACARMHGDKHAPGCPRTPSGYFHSDYIAGWNAARIVFGDLAQQTHERTRKEEHNHFAWMLRKLADELENAS